jgi:hypothetical protein
VEDVYNTIIFELFGEYQSILKCYVLALLFRDQGLESGQVSYFHLVIVRHILRFFRKYGVYLEI